MTTFQATKLLKQKLSNDSNVPVLPSGIAHLLKVLNNDEITYIQLAKELESFPSIAIKIVSIANSAWALPASPITTLPQACSRIGINIVRSVSIALSISQVFDPSRCHLFNTKTFWTSALLNAEAAYLCANNNPSIDPDTARLTGLLHNIGLLWLANQKPEETSNAITDANNNEDISLAECLYKRLELDYYIVGEHLACTMELPELITNAISTNVTCNKNDLTPFTINHCYAKQITSTVLSLEKINTKDEVILPEEYQDEAIYHQLIERLPKINNMANAIFTN